VEVNIFSLKSIREYSRGHPLVKFLFVLVIFLGYLTFAAFSYGLDNGIAVAVLTWSFFVFCTPIADAGILVDFPLRMLTGIRMIYSEIIVWALALILNLVFYIGNITIYDKTLILKLFKQIISTPVPYWIIIILSAIGTFLSIYFGDEILDIISKRKGNRVGYERHGGKYQIVIFFSIIALVVAIYYIFLKHLDISIPLY
jgi:hypothetical protein